MAENTNLLFIHKHQVSIATAKKIFNNCYEINGYLEAKKNDKLYLPFFNIYISFFCQTCGKIVLKSKKIQEFIVSSKKRMKGLRNYFNKEKILESVYFEDRPNENLKNNPEYITREFFIFNELPIYDNNIIYIGTEEEQKEYFHKKFKDYEYSFNEVLNKGLILFKGHDNKNNKDNKDKNCKEGYHIIIRANSILSLDNIGWEIIYPNGKEEYEKLIKKPMIIVSVVGNRNKGKSFILGKLLDYNIPQGFSLKNEGISVAFGDKDDYCIAMMESAGQEVPLLSNVINPEEDINEEENIKLNEIKEDNNNEKKKEEKAIDEIGLLEQCLRDKLITEKFFRRIYYTYI